MGADVFLYRLFTVVCVAVSAEVPAGVVAADIDTLRAAAMLPLIFIFFVVDVFAGDRGNKAVVDALCRLDTGPGEILRQRAGGKR